jgi:hypothetical protein
VDEAKLMKAIQDRLALSNEALKLVEPRLKQIVADTEDQFLIKLKGAATTIPDELGFVVRGVVVKRFNRFKNEGMSSYGQEGQSISYETDDFAEFEDDYQQWIDDHAEDSADKHKIRFLNPYAIKKSGD